MTINKIDLDHIEQVARAATPGQWNIKRDGVLVGGPLRESNKGTYQRQIATFSVTSHDDDAPGTPNRQEANTAYVADVSPEVVLALVARLREAERLNRHCVCGCMDDAA